MENMSLGLILMLVGMVTVFCVLIIIIYLCKLLIRVVNKVAPEEVAVHKKPTGANASTDALTMSIINAAVAQITGGQGSVAKVEKL